MRARLSGFAALVVLLLEADCSSRPPPTAHCAEPIVADYPPPPAQVEMVGVRRAAPCQWIDGSWEWIGRRWQWKPGAWVIPPADCVRAAPIMIWLPSQGRGALYYRPASFCPNEATQAKAPARGCGSPKPCPFGLDAGAPPAAADDADARISEADAGR